MKRTATLLRVLLASGALVLIATLVLAARTRPAVHDSKAPVVATPAATPGQAGMRVYIDPETGQIGVPNPLPQLPPEEKPGAEPVLHEEVLPDGSVMIDLKGTSVDYMVMQIDPKTGKRTTTCTDDPKKALQAPASTPQPADR
jgi:hypothetical protein